MNEHINTFGRMTNLVETRDFHSILSRFENEQAQSAYFCNVHMLMLSQDDPILAEAMDSADWVFADGVPVAWLQKRISGKDAQVVRGYEIMCSVCERAVTTGENVGLLGSTEEVMKALVSELRDRYDGINVAHQSCPPFMENELTSTPGELKAIRDAEVDWLFVGLGCPKQEKWIARYKDELNCHVLGVGAAFDWVSGQVSMPPKWMESSGLGWLHRFMKNPLKMWRRYLIYNVRFLVRVIGASIRGKQASKDK